MHELAGTDWKTVNDSIYVYRDGLWTQDQPAFYALMMRHCDSLGPGYGESLRKMRDVMQLAKTMNVVDEKWTQRLNRLGPGLVPFSDGIYDIMTRKLWDFEHGDMLTCKFDFAAPERGE